MPPPRRDLTLDELAEAIGRPGRSAFALLDATDEPRVPAKVADLGPEVADCLWRGDARRDYWAVAPYLARLDAGLLAWLDAELAAGPWGILALAAGPLPLDEAARHFRRFFWIRDDRDEPMYFRYYDPRVLPPFLGACTPPQLGEFFGPFEALGTLEPGRATLWDLPAPATRPA